MGRVTEADEARQAWLELGAIAAATEPALRARVAERWAEAARYEHASIASFDRFALQLLAIGAPPPLLEGAHRAALDEIAHARLSFRIASIYAGKPLGPGPLPIDPSALADFSLEKTLHETIEEGCVGETLAAAHAELLCEHVQGRALKDAFAIVQRDEAQHAALAFQFARWALATFGASARMAAERAFTYTLDKLSSIELVAASEPELLRHGLLGERERHGASLRAVKTIVEPMRDELLRGTG